MTKESINNKQLTINTIMKKKIMYALLCAALVSPLYSCGDDEEPTPASNNEQGNNSNNNPSSGEDKNNQSSGEENNNQSSGEENNNQGSGEENNNQPNNGEENNTPEEKTYTISFVVEENSDKIKLSEYSYKAKEDEELSISYEIDENYGIESVSSGKVDSEKKTISLTCYGYDEDVKVVVKNRNHKASLMVSINGEKKSIGEIDFKTGEEFTCEVPQEYRGYKFSHANCTPYFKQTKEEGYSVTLKASEYEDCEITFYLKAYNVEISIYDENNNRKKYWKEETVELNKEYSISLSDYSGYEFKSLNSSNEITAKQEGNTVKYTVTDADADNTSIKIYLQKETIKYPTNTDKESILGKYYYGYYYGYEFTTNADGKIVLNLWEKLNGVASIAYGYEFKQTNGYMNTFVSSSEGEIDVRLKGTTMYMDNSTDWVTEASSLDAMKEQMKNFSE